MKRTTLTVIALLAVLATASPSAAEVTDIDSSQLRHLLSQGVPVIDVRTSPEWQQTGIIEGSHLITFFDSAGRYDADAWLRQLAAIVGPDDPVVLICRTGSRTVAIANFLDQRAGYRQVYNMRQGIVRWIADGNSTVPPRTATPNASQPGG